MEHRRRPLVLPACAAFSPTGFALLYRIDAAADRLARLTVGTAGAGLDRSAAPAPELLRPLRHPLSPRFAPVTSQFRSDRSRLEWPLLCKHFAAISDALTSPRRDAFAESLARLAQDVSGCDRFRLDDVRTAADHRGHYVVYPSPAESAGQLDALRDMLCTNARRPAAFDAVVALVCLTNCHPFTDGNGRIAQILFNLLLQRGRVAPTFYLPLHELAVLSRGGYIARVREAELFGRWIPLFGYIHAAQRLWAEMVTRAPAADRARDSNSHARQAFDL